MILELVKDPDILSKRASEFNIEKREDEINDIVADLEDTLKANEDLIYVCANEVGKDIRALAINLGTDIVTMFNPAIKSKAEMQLTREQDRITGKEYIIPRWAKLQIVYQDKFGDLKCTIEMPKELSVVFSQALDVLDGMFTSDYGLEIIPEFDEATDEDRKLVITEYLNTLSKLSEDLDKDLMENEDTRQIWDANKYMRALADGTITPYEEEDLSNRQKKKLLNGIKAAQQQLNKMKFWRKLKNGKGKSN